MIFFRKKKFYKKIKLKETNKIKKQLINYINSDTKSKKYDNVSKTNWDKNLKPNCEMVMFYYNNFHSEIEKQIKCDCDVGLVWYQKYDKNTKSNHEYHNHYDINNSHLSGIYYVKLKSKKLITKFIVDDNIVTPNVSEGDLILFDSRILHMSPPNETNHDKIILSFNINTFGVYPKF
jgi:hypothetical protein